MKQFKTEDDLGNLREKIQFARKTVLTRVIKMDEDFMCLTKEGPLMGRAGGYLAIGAWGEVYPIEEGIFADTYEIVEHELQPELEKGVIQATRDAKAMKDMQLMFIRSDCKRVINDPYAGPIVKEFAQKILATAARDYGKDRAADSV